MHIEIYIYKNMYSVTHVQVLASALLNMIMSNLINIVNVVCIQDTVMANLGGCKLSNLLGEGLAVATYRRFMISGTYGIYGAALRKW